MEQRENSPLADKTLRLKDHATAPTPHPFTRELRRWNANYGRFVVDGGFALACFLLAFRALDPLSGVDPVRPLPRLLQNSVAGLLVALQLVRALISPRFDIRACALLPILTALYLGTLLDRWALSTPGRLTSALSGGLSYSFGALPWLALLLSVSVLSLGFLQFEALRNITTRLPARWSIFVAGSVSGLSTILWLRAILGYVSGSPNL